jgi:hypothetical protein
VAELKIYFNHLLLYDYIAFGAAFVAFLLFFLLAILFSRVKFLFIVCLLLAFVGLLGLPIAGKIVIDQKIRTVEVEHGGHKNLKFANSMITFVKIKNTGKVDLSECRIKIKIIKNGNNKLKSILNKLKPKLVKSKKIGPLKKGENKEVKMVIDNFNLDEKHTLQSSGYCY